MAPLNKSVNNLIRKISEDSTSWGALVIWVCMLAVLILMMVSFSHSYPQAL